jgi:putative metallopeptidase DUF4344
MRAWSIDGASMMRHGQICQRHHRSNRSGHDQLAVARETYTGGASNAASTAPTSTPSTNTLAPITTRAGRLVLPKQYVQGYAEFVSGNMLFVLLHELGHASITQMGLPVLGRMEDAADSFATLTLIRVGSDFSHGVLTAAAKGWFLADRRDRETGLTLAFYSEHGLNLQRAYQIVCLMVGSDEDKFKDLAEETKLPEARQHTCLGDYSNAAFSWDLLLKPHRRPSDQPKTKFNVVYGPAEGRAKVVEQVASSIRLLETVAERASDELAWPAPLTLEMQSCGFPNARWDLRMRMVTLCYELAVEFADLYRDFGKP